MTGIQTVYHIYHQILDLKISLEYFELKFIMAVPLIHLTSEIVSLSIPKYLNIYTTYLN